MKNKSTKQTKTAWDSKEDDLLKQYYGNLSMKQLRLIFEGRSENAIRSRVKRLRKKGWSFNTTRR
jgi:hypothetical protein|tara:strand:+ start:426 stop:620 length:195 start_codon:yes stop_codon:yes gene_type:complete